MFGLGKKADPVEVRATLAEAMRDLGGEELALRALQFFENRDAYEAWADNSAGEPIWVSDGYEPSPAEVAADILSELLIADRRGVIIDWAEGPSGVLDDIDTLFERAGKPKIDSARRDALVSQCSSLKRGESIPKLMAPIEQDAAARGLVIHWWNTEADSHLPLLLTPEARKRWSGASFGKNFPVLK